MRNVLRVLLSLWSINLKNLYGNLENSKIPLTSSIWWILSQVCFVPSKKAMSWDNLTLIVRGSQLHIWVSWISPPPGKCSINGPNELKICVWPHMGCVWEIPWPKRYNHVSGSRLSPRCKNPKISGIFKFGYIFHFFHTELTSKNPKTLPNELLVKKWSILL